MKNANGAWKQLLVISKITYHFSEISGKNFRKKKLLFNLNIPVYLEL